MIEGAPRPVKPRRAKTLTTAYQIGIFRGVPRLALPRCLLCDEAGESPGVCDTCARLLEPPAAFWLEPGLPVTSAFAYRFPLDHLVHRFKFSGDMAAGRWLAASLADAVLAQPRPDLLLPAPSSSRRLRERGFDPALLLARWVGKRTGCAVEPHALAKRLHTRAQTSLTREARSQNLSGAFTSKRSLAGLRVAVVDDVVTTGATQRALAACARQAGAREVVAWAVAMTPAPS